MRKDKNRALTLRKTGKSYREIEGLLKIPRATLSDWFSRKDWSKDIAKKLNARNGKTSTIRIIELNKIRGKNLARVYEEARREATAEFQRLKYNPLFVAGRMLYWGEGDKRTHGQTRLTNTDPEMIRLFVFFLRHVCCIPDMKIKGGVLIYPDLNADECRRYWARSARIGADNFLKCVTIQGRHKTRKLSHGVCSIYVASTYFKVKMLEWINLIPKELMNKGYYASMSGVAGIV